MQLLRPVAITLAAYLGACAAGPASRSGPAPTSPGAPQLIAMPHRTGDIHDFDFLAGGWTVHNRVRKSLPPAVGGFEGDRGEFFSVDEQDGKPVLYRLLWTRHGPDHASWEQAYSFDRKEWIPNWVMELSRTAPAGGC
jgi:hypothetical protein